MNLSDLLAFKGIKDIEQLLIAQQASINKRFDRLEKLIIESSNFVSPELEQEIKSTATQAADIDNKVP